MNKIELFKPNEQDVMIDDRGKIMPFLPDKDIKEFVFIETVAGLDRGHHYHPEFDEYIMITSGGGIYYEKIDNNIREIPVRAGDCIKIPQGIHHTFIADTITTTVSCLTKKWNDCDNPILR